MVLIFPTICCIVILSSLFIAVTSVLWMPLLTLVLQITNMLIYDLDSPEQKRNRFFVIGEAIAWNIGIQGCVQPMLALFVAAVMCPMISLVILAGEMFYIK